MGLREYPARFCDQTPFIGRRFMYDREKEKYEERLYEGRLQVKPDMMFAKLDTPNGLQVIWQHGTWSELRPVDWSGHGDGVQRHGPARLDYPK